MKIQNPALLPELKTCPAVFAVENEYQIMVPVKSDVLFWVEVNGKCYYDHCNGILRSDTRLHRAQVPMSELDAAGAYTIFYRKIIERKPYFSETEEPVSATYSFIPVKTQGDIHIYHLSDTHGRFEHPAAAAGFFGDELDVLILNGDIPDHSGDVKNFDLIYELCGHLTGGNKPCVFSRGNHDMRGICAEHFTEYTPTRDGHSYYSFRIGPIWGLLMDCGEDKNDDAPGYGNTISCHAFRAEETAWMEQQMARFEAEAHAPDVQYRFVISHIPFAQIFAEARFAIEHPRYTHWLKLLGTHIQPQLHICGHTHRVELNPVGSEKDGLGQVCPVVIGGRPVRDEEKGVLDYYGCALTLHGDGIKVEFTNSRKEVLDSHEIPLQ